MLMGMAVPIQLWIAFPVTQAHQSRMNPIKSRRQSGASSIFSGGPRVVGIVDSPGAMRSARRLKAGEVDFLEWRADCLGGQIFDSPTPWIVTVRHPSEGGANRLSVVQRRALALEILPRATILDVEVRSMPQMLEVITAARGAHVGILASFHNFQKTPTTARLQETIQRAYDIGADAVKIATVTESASDMARLLALFERAPLPLAVMGMGRLGMASRIALATAGSVLNYGWIDRPNVSGQWSVRELQSLLAKCVNLA
jgi:3-dehydroquinate dehydratase I